MPYHTMTSNDIIFDQKIVEHVAKLMDEYNLGKLTFNRVDDTLKVEGSFYHKMTVKAAPKYAEGF